MKVFSQKKKSKPMYYGVYGNMRGVWIKNNDRELYDALEASGGLEEYLDGYQRSYEKKFEYLYESMKEEYQIQDHLHSSNFVQFIIRHEKLFFAIREIIRKEIEQ